MNKMLRSSLRLSKRLLTTSSPQKVAEPLRHFTPTVTLNKDDGKQTTVTGQEIEHHAKLMKEWWLPNGPMKGLHSYNLIRVPFIRDGIITPECERTCTPLLGKKILDIGCGGGILSEALAKLGAEVTGVDASEQLIELAKSHSRDNHTLKNKPTYIFSTIEDHANTPKYQCYYDAVVASEIFEHVANEHKELFVKKCVEVLRPGGRVFFTTPNRTRVAQVAVVFVAEFINAIPRGTHQWDMFTTPTELTFLLERSGCHVEVVLGSFYDVIFNKWWICENKSFVFFLQAVKNE